MRKLFLIITCALTCALSAQTTVSGRVLDGAANNEPAIGASVLVAGTQVGTITDMDGHFSLEVPEGKFILQISMVGYKTQVVNIRGKERVDVTLQEDTQLMDEVVVVGYGTMKKRDLSGSVSLIKSEDIMSGGQMNVAESLEGKIAGVDVKASDGAPGSGVSITVRGANSFTTSSQPLYIVDGIPFGTDPNGVPSSGANEGQNQSQNPLSMINPNDIEKIEVLKDASATAIYGSRGANGVVIITTRKGQEGRPRVELNVKGGVQQIARKVQMLGRCAADSPKGADARRVPLCALSERSSRQQPSVRRIHRTDPLSRRMGVPVYRKRICVFARNIQPCSGGLPEPGFADG